MASPKSAKFDFETYAIGQFDTINKKLDNQNQAFVPREEIMLMAKATADTTATLTRTLADHTTLLTHLKETDDRQQGRIDSQRNWITYLGLFSGAVITFLIFVLTRHPQI